VSDPWKRKEVIGDATLYLGDCLEILPHVGEVDAVVTDPPYGIGLSNHDRAGNTRKIRDWTIENDHDISTACSVIEWSDEREVTAVMFCSPDNALPGRWRSRLVWHKHGLGMGGDPSKCWKRDWEMILVRNNGNLIGGRDSSVLFYPIGSSEFHHPCQKPVRLMEYLISKIGAQTTLDPFMGSGTTGVACANLGRKFIGIEIEERYFDIACERIRAAYAQGRLFE